MGVVYLPVFPYCGAWLSGISFPSCDFIKWGLFLFSLIVIYDWDV